MNENTPCCKYPNALGGFGVYICPNKGCSFAVCRPCHGKLMIKSVSLNDTGNRGCNHGSLTKLEENKAYFRAKYYESHPDQVRACSQCDRWITKDSKASLTMALLEGAESGTKRLKVLK